MVCPLIQVCVFIFTNLIIATMTAVDAESLVVYSGYIITLPNLSWIPLFNFEPCNLHARRDGCFGAEDCFQYPQVWSEKHPWMPCILCKPEKGELEHHSLQVLWWDPSFKLYKVAPGSAFGDLGTLSIKAWDPMQQLQLYLHERLQTYQEQGHVNRTMNSYEWAIKSTLLHLRNCPLSFCDLVGQVTKFQCLCLDLHAMLDYIKI